MKKIFNLIRLFLIKMLGATANESIKEAPVAETKKLDPPQKIESTTVTPEDLFIDIRFSEMNIQYKDKSIKNQLTRAVVEYIDKFSLIEYLGEEPDFFINCNNYTYRCYFSFMPKEYLEAKYKKSSYEQTKFR